MATRNSKAPTGEESTAATEGWLLLIYKVPSESSRARVAVWREVKRLGGFYVQQAVCVLPDREELRAGLARVREKVTELGGSSVFLTLAEVDDDARDQFVRGLRNQSAKEYAELVEECDARFKENQSTATAEEIRQDLDKLRRRLAKVEGRDWMDAEGKELARSKVAAFDQLLTADLSAGTAGKTTRADDPTGDPDE